MPKKILVAGSTGMLGRCLVEVFSDADLLALDHSQLDISNFGSVERVVADFRPDCILNAAAYTKVDLAETEQDAAFSTNALGCKNLALAAARSQSTIVSFSTDYVFDGTSKTPYREWDLTAPINAYGRSKLAGELAIQQLCANHLILRTSWLYGWAGRHFVGKIRSLATQRGELRVVNDQVGSPTLTSDLADATRELLDKDRRGLYHLSNGGACTWFDLAEVVVNRLPVECKVIPVQSSEFPTEAKRPKNSVLDNCVHRLEGFAALRHWRDAVEEYLASEDV